MNLEVVHHKDPCVLPSSSVDGKLIAAIGVDANMGIEPAKLPVKAHSLEIKDYLMSGDGISVNIRDNNRLVGRADIYYYADDPKNLLQMLRVQLDPECAATVFHTHQKLFCQTGGMVYTGYFMIKSIYIHPDYRLRGIATAIIQNLTEILSRGLIFNCFCFVAKLTPIELVGEPLTTSNPFRQEMADKDKSFELRKLRLRKMFSAAGFSSLSQASDIWYRKVRDEDARKA